MFTSEVRKKFLFFQNSFLPMIAAGITACFIFSFVEAKVYISKLHINWVCAAVV
jgi:hypothetical protein